MLELAILLLFAITKKSCSFIFIVLFLLLIYGFFYSLAFPYFFIFSPLRYHSHCLGLTGVCIVWLFKALWVVCTLLFRFLLLSFLLALFLSL